MKNKRVKTKKNESSFFSGQAYILCRGDTRVF